MEKESRRQRRRAGFFVAAANALILVLLLQGCRTGGPGGSGSVVSRRILTPRMATNPSATPMALNPDIDWPVPPAKVQSENTAVVPPPPPPPSAPPPGGTLAPNLEPLPAPSIHKKSAHHAAPGTYVVKSGDTLGRIAKAHHTTVKALRAANHLKSDRIVVGQKLRLH